MIRNVCSIPEKWQVAPSARFAFPEGMVWNDVTLREGEQTPGVSLTMDEKYELARRLDSFGVTQLQLPRLSAKAENREFVRTVIDMGLKCQTEIMIVGMDNPKWKEDVDDADSFGPTTLHLSFRTSSFKQTWTQERRESWYALIPEMIAYCKAKGKLVDISFTDATRADFDFLMNLIHVAAHAGADRIHVCDSKGVGTPLTMYSLVWNAVRAASPYGAIIGVHCHDDGGLAVANTLACIHAGARLLDLSVNGIGDRCGNACLLETAATLELLYGCTTGLDLSQLTSLSQYVEKITCVPTSPLKPYVGTNAFTESVASHAAEVLEGTLEGYPFDPAVVGSSYKAGYGRLTNARVIELTAKKAGRPIPPEAYKRIIARLSDVALASKGKALYESDFWAVVDDCLKGE